MGNEINKLSDEDKLVELTKLKIGYTEIPAGTCSNCKYTIGTGDWEYICTYSNLVRFTVLSRGRCDKFKSKS
jgi:hypothetical protein